MPKAYFESILGGGLGKPDTGIEHNPPRDLSGFETRIYRAKTTASKAVFKLWCSKQYNKILVPNGANWAVYFLAATTEPGKVVLGGHHRVDIDSSGLKIIGQEQFSNSCLEMDAKPGEDGKSHLVVTHLRSELPTEIHAYLSRLHRVDLYVAIKEEVWYVTDGVVVRLGNMKNFKK